MYLSRLDYFSFQCFSETSKFGPTHLINRICPIDTAFEELEQDGPSILIFWLKEEANNREVVCWNTWIDKIYMNCWQNCNVFRSFQITFTEQSVDFGWIRTRIVRVEGEHADNLTFITAQNWNVFVQKTYDNKEAGDGP